MRLQECRRVVFTLVLGAVLILSAAAGSRSQERTLVAAELHQKALQRGAVRVLVQIDAPYVPEVQLPTPAHVVSQRQHIASTQGVVRRSLRGIAHRVVRDFRGAAPVMAIEVGPDGLRMLESLRGVVTHVVEDTPRHPALAESVPRIQADQAAALGYDGTGAVIVILDTGVDGTHPFFQDGSGASRIVHEACFSSNSLGATTLCPNGLEQDLSPGSGDSCTAAIDCEHGTLVAGIAAGRGASFDGVAPGAGIVAIQVFSRFDDPVFCGSPAFTPCVGSFPSDELEAGVYIRDTLLAAPRSMNIAAINLSFGSGAFSVPCDASFPGETTLITDLRARGVATVVASGNAGLNGSLTAPACIGSAISVGATTDPPSETIATFSNRAIGMSLLAPGTSINTSAPGGGFQIVDGTSMAAPHVAGVFAIFKQAVPSATVSQVLAALQATGQSIGGFKRVRVLDALATFSNVVPTVQFGSGSYSVNEGDTTNTATITVTRTGPASVIATTTSTVLVSTSPGTATAGTTGSADFVALTNQLVTFGPGETSRTVQITIRGDVTVEPNETVVLTLSNPVGAAIGTPTAVLTLVNDDVPGAIRFDQSTYSVSEGAGTAPITLRRTGGLAAGAIATVSTMSGGTATAPADYTAVNNLSVAFAAGSATATFTVTIADDSLAEADETVNLQIVGVGGGATLGSPSTAVLTIVDNDVAGSVQFSQATYQVTEGAATATITVNRSGGAASGVTVQYRVVPGNPGTATGGGVDYTLATGTLSFGAGDTVKTFTAAIVNDTLIEPDQTVNLELFNPSAGLAFGAQRTATLTIQDNDAPTFNFGSATYSVAEGAAASVTVVRTNGVGSAVTVGYQVQAASTATGAGQDYELASGTVTFGVGVTTQTITIPTTADALLEGDETIVLRLVNPSAGTVIAPDTTTVTIVDNTNVPGTIQFSAATYSVNESAGQATITLQRTGSAAASAVAMVSTVAGGTATAGADYTAFTNKAVTFAVGSPTTTFTVAIVDDTLVEPDETVNLQIVSVTGGGTIGAPSTATLTIVSNDLAGTVQFSQAAYEVTEGTATATITVNRTGGAASGVTVQYRVVPGNPGTATGGGVDYTLATGMLTFGAGDTSKTFTVSIVNDAIIEPDETVNLELFNPSSGLVIGAQGATALTIHDNDTPTFRFGAATYSVVEGAAASVTVVRTNGVGSAVTVGYQIQAASTATGAGQDYTLANGTVTFGIGIITQTITIPTTADALVDGDETIVLKLVNPSAGTTIAPDTTTVTIVDNTNTSGTIQFSAATYSVNENAGSATITLQRTGSAAASAVAMVSTVAGGTATAGADYTAVTNKAVTFAVGSSTATLTVAIVDDTLVEPDETVNVQIMSVTGGAIGAPSTAVLTIVSDDVAGIVQLGQAAYQVTEGVATAPITVNRTGGSAGGVTVQYRVVPGNPGTAGGGGVDYTLATGTLTFGANETAKTFAVSIVNDTLIEPDETVNLELFNPSPGLAIGPLNTTTLTIHDNDAPTFRFGAATYTVAEGSVASVTVVRANGVGTEVTVGYQLQAAGTATGGGVDYTLANGTLTFAAGVTTQTITIPTTVDTLFEGNETIVLKLVSPSLGAVIAPDTTTVTIVDDDTPGTIQFSLAAYSVIESVGPAVVRVTRTGTNLASGITLQFTTNDGTATEGSDYASATRVLTFAAGEAFKDVSIAILDDSLPEGNETVGLTLGNPSGGATLGANRTAVLTILDDEQSLQFSAPTYVVTEAATPVTVTVLRIGPAFGTVTVDYACAAGSATNGFDYTAVSGTLTFLPGIASKTFTVPILSDTVFEATESMSMVLTNPTGSARLGPQSIATISIADNDPPGALRFSAAAYTVSEAGALATITVQRTQGTASAVTVDYATVAGGTATAGTDYIATSGTLAFNANDTSKTFTVAVLNDALYAGGVTMNLALSNPTGGATLGTPSTAVLTITDDDTPGTIQFSTPTYSVIEIAGPAVVRVTRTGTNLATGITVQFTTANGTATAGVDYTGSSQVLTFAGGEAFKDVAIPILDDGLSEGNETVVLTLSNPSGGATLGTNRTAVLTILDDEQTLQFSAPVYVVTEATTPATVTVLRTGPPLGTVTVEYATAAGSAGTGSDYSSVGGTLTFPPGIASRTFPVPILSDTVFEATESVALLLTNATGSAQLGPLSTSTITILDNDPPGAIRFSASTSTVSEGGGVATITVQRTPGTASAVTVDYATVAGGTATAGVDYLTTSGTLTFNAGEPSKTFTIPILNDTRDEPDETVNLALSNPTGGATLGTPSTAVLTITDNDVPGPITLSAPTYTVSETAGLALIKVNRTGGASGVTVSFTTADGSATAPADYTAVSQTLSFGPGETSKIVAIPIVDDGLREGNETVRLILSNPTGGAALGTFAQAVLTITDNEIGPTVQFGAATYTVAENVVGGVANVTITRTGSTVPGQTVLFSASPGTAGGGTDFTSISNQLVTFTGTQASVIVPVTILDNTTIAGSRTVNLTLSSPGGGLSLGVPRTAVLTILEDDATVQLAGASYSVTEGAAATLTVTRTGGTLVTATVSYATSPGTATAGADYTTQTGTLVFGPGVTSQIITVATINDTLVEGPETFTVTLASPSPATSIGLGSPSTATVTITDNDAFGTLRLASATYSVTEGAAASLVVTRTGGSAGTVTVQYATSNGGGGAAAIGGAPTAAGTDYTTMAGTLTFLNGVTSQTITVPTKADTLQEGPETFTVTLASPGGGATLGAPAAAVVTIVDDETPRLQFATASSTVAESAGSVTVTVQRVGPTTAQNTVQYALAGVTATGGGVDFVSTGGVLTFAAGVASRTIVVPIVNDTINEGPETFTMTLSNPTGGAILGTPSVTTVTITDNDPAGVVQFSQLSYTVVEGRTATITVTRTGTAGPVAVSFATSNGTATAPADYTGTAGTLTFQAGETTKTFTVTTAPDALTEGSESVVLTLSAPTNGLALGSMSTATLWVVDEEQSVQFGSAGYSVIEGGTVLVTVTRSGVPAGTVTVNYQVGGGSTATESADFTLMPATGTLTFAPGVATLTITVKTVNDLAIEGPEAIVLQLSSPSGAVLGTPSTTQIALIDNERSDLVVGSLAGPAQAATGSTMTVVATVINQAGGAAPATTLGIFISSSSTTPGAGTRIGLVAIPGIAGGASYTAIAPVNVPAGLAPGNYFLSAITDLAGVAIEESDTNNGLTAPAQVDIVFFQ